MRFYPLSRWWQQEDIRRIVAIDTHDQVDMSRIKQRVADWTLVLSRQTGQRWAVYHTDACEFLAIILALWQVSKTAVVAGDNLPGTQEQLQTQVDGFLGEFNGASLAPLETATQPEWIVIRTDFVALILFTSGSSGEPKQVEKTIGQIETELNALAGLSVITRHVVLSTVTHQHLYGLTFRLLQPFCQQQPFPRFLQEYPEDLLEMAAQYGDFCLVSSPTHLARMNRQQDWHRLEHRCQQVFSSAAPLQRSDSLQVAALLNTRVIEIYGSTETGALAWRCQQHTDADALWQPLQHVGLTQHDNSITVMMKSEMIPITLADRVLMAGDGTFSLQGRSDQIVKVEGKRLSLTELEATLSASGLFQAVKALALSRNRSETAIVAVLSAQGETRLKQTGKKAFIHALKQKLALHFEKVLIPRRWRFVAELPVNTQGKLTLTALSALFDKAENKWPLIFDEKINDNEVCLKASLPKDLDYFEGHFSQQPILPGVVQVHWAAKYGQQFFAITGDFIRLEAVKFQQLLMPEHCFSLTLQFDATKAKLYFRYESESGVHSSGKICYAS